MEVDRINTSIVKNNLPLFFPNGYLMDFYYDFSKPVTGNSIILNLAFEMYLNKGKIEYYFEATATYLLKTDMDDVDKKYEVCYKCLINEITAYKIALNKLSLSGYPPLDSLIPSPSFDNVLPVLKELFDPGSLSSDN